MRLYLERAQNWVQLDDHSLIGAGGEGRVMRVVGQDSLAAKVFDDGGSSERIDKLRTMIDDGSAADPAASHVAVAWPSDLLLEEPGGPVVGYVMPRVRDGRVIDDYYNPQARLENCPLFHYEYLMVAARNLAAAIHSLHERGCVVGDIKQANILVTQSALVTLVDTDSFQVRDWRTGVVYRCPVGSAEYTPPELQGLATPGLLKPEHDLFGLAVLIFQLLMEGAHPFAGVYTGEDDPPPIGERIMLGWFPHAPVRSTAATFQRQSYLLPGPPFVPARRSLPFAVLPVALRELFLRCFVEGRRDPALRPSAREWQQALDSARAELVRCGTNPQHRFGGHLGVCPWCERSRTFLAGRDPYPAPGAVEPPLPRYHAPRHVLHGDPTPAWRPVFQPGVPTGRPPGLGPYAVAALGLPLALFFVSLHHSRQAERLTPSDTDQWAAPRPAHRTFDRWAAAPADVASQNSRGLGSSADARSTEPPPPAIQPGAGAEPDLSANGTFALAATGPTRLALLDCRTGRTIGELQPYDGQRPIAASAVSRSGRWIAAACRGGVVVSDRDTGFERSLVPRFEGVRALAFSPDETMLALSSGQADDPVTIVKPESGQVVRGFAAAYGEMVARIRFSPDGSRLFASTLGSSSGETKLYCWNVRTGEPIWSLSKRSWSPCFTISPDGRTLAVGGWELDLRNAVNGDQEQRGPASGEIVADAIPLCHSGDGRRIAIASSDSVGVYTLGDEGSVVTTLPAGDVVAAAFSADGSRLTTLSETNGIEEWDLTRRHRIRRHRIPRG